MSTINNTDLFLIARGTTNYQVTAADVAAFTGGGGGGVTGVGVTAPITDTGTATAPIIGISAATTGALGAVQIGTNVQVTAGGTISILDASDTQKGVIETATLAEAATGTSATLALTASTGVPKTPADMTGALYMPGGNDGARPGTPATGMLRYNSQGGTPVAVEYYDGANWVTLGRGVTGLVFLSEITVSNSATADFTNLPSTYDELLLVGARITPTLDDNPFLVMRTSTNNGGTYDSGNVYRASEGGGDNSWAFIGKQPGTTGGGTPAAAQYWSFATFLNNFNQASIYPSIRAEYNTYPNVGVYSTTVNAAATINAFRLLTTTGNNMVSGTFRLYGVVNS